MKAQNVEITEPVDLCLRNGKLNPSALGWSRKPIIRCNLKGHLFRKKKWNYWAVFNEECLFSATVSNLDYIGVVFCYFLDLKSMEFFEKTVSVPFGIGCHLPDSVDGDVSFNSKKMRVNFKRHSTQTLIEAELKASENSDFKARIEVFHDDYESLNVVVPWSWYRYQYTSKEFCLPARGEITFKGKNYLLDLQNTFAVLDFGRGIWRYSSFWNWASFATHLADQTTVGVNLGAGWTDNTGTNENAILLNGKITKVLSDVAFKYDKNDLMKPWHIYTKDSDEIDLEFQPIFRRVAKTDLLILSSKVNQMIGLFKGFVRDENRKTYIIRDALGWAEEHYAKW
ncbi:DUF2804 domain-containing protein [Pseudothermotoga sp. U03pept]|uniref:DUF2804 domain-containing protein n=1 Tax=Pseudothermotoga sp. U03pept TaxID=3447012 RepID=UPI003F103103